MRPYAAYAAALLVAIAHAPTACAHDEPLRIGVLLERPDDARGALSLAIEDVNLSGGIGGRSIDLVFVDPRDLEGAARRLASDPSITAVIGPDTSQALYDIGQIFVDAKKPIVSPSATAGGIFRAFAGTGYVWRTVESDLAQLETGLAILRRDGASSVALLTSEDVYGATFFDWFGFFVTELGMRATAVERWDQLHDRACEPHVERVLAGDPDAVIVVPSDPASAVCLRRALAARARPRVLFSDAANDPRVLEELGTMAEGMEGTIASADPDSGFDAAYRAELGAPPPAFAAQAYDALLLLAYGLVRSGGEGGERLAQAIADVTAARGAKTSAGRRGVRDTLTALARGERPDPTGAAGPLEFDAELHLDPIASTYARWRVEGGRFVAAEHLRTNADDPNGTRSIYRSLASEAHAQAIASGTALDPGPRTGLRAFVLATTRGWDNYRHQADALAVYQRLRNAGVSDDRIVLAIADDVGSDPRNTEPGVVRQVASGPNLRAGAAIDHRIEDLGIEDVLALLRESGSSDGDDLFVFVEGHAGPRGLDWHGSPTSGAVLTGSALAEAIAGAHARRVLVAIDSCFSGAIGEAIAARGQGHVLVLTSSRPFESTIATNWDPRREIWLADELTAAFVKEPASLSLLDLYRRLYLRVGGSHVSVYNAPRFGDVGAVSLQDFVMP